MSEVPNLHDARERCQAAGNQSATIRIGPAYAIVQAFRVS
jgi:hypothetical protein